MTAPPCVRRGLSALLLACTAGLFPPAGRCETENLKAVQKGDQIIIESKPPKPSTEGAPAPAAPKTEEPSTPKSVAELATDYITAMDVESRLAALDRLAAAVPQTAEDVRRLLDLFVRDAAARSAASASLNRLSPQAQGFGPYFLGLLEDEEPLMQAFAVAGLLRLRYEPALPALEKLAEGRFPRRSPSFELGPQENNLWQNRFEALRALALWKGESVLPLLMRKAKEAPAVAGLAASYFWEKSFDQIVRWTKSRSREDQEAARAAWAAEVPPEALRATWPKLLALTLDRKEEMVLRHRAAIKLGLGSGEEEAKTLLEKHGKAAADKETKTRLLLETALFASQSPLAIPLLEGHVRDNPSPQGRAAALVQLKGMLPPERYLELLREAAKNDPDMENQETFRRELAELRK